MADTQRAAFFLAKAETLRELARQARFADARSQLMQLAFGYYRLADNDWAGAPDAVKFPEARPWSQAPESKRGN